METFMKRTFTCPICGVTSEEERVWNPCEKYHTNVCMSCCVKCKYHVAWSGLHMCSFKSELQLLKDQKQETVKVIMQHKHALTTTRVKEDIVEQNLIEGLIDKLQGRLELLEEVITQEELKRDVAWSNSKYVTTERKERC